MSDMRLSCRDFLNTDPQITQRGLGRNQTILKGLVIQSDPERVELR